MADSYRDIANSLLDRASLRFQAKGTPYDVLYTEQETLDRSAAVSKWPQVAAGSAQKLHIPSKCIPGAAHPQCGFLILVDAYRTGGDDHHDNWTLLYRVDLKAYVAAYNADHSGAPLTAWPDILAKDGTSKNDQYGDGGAVIEWSFDVINPDNYTAPAKNTAHPIVSDAFLTCEVVAREGPLAHVSRRYEQFPTLIDYSVDPETRALITTQRRIFHTPVIFSVSTGEELTIKALGPEFALVSVESATPADYNYPAWVDWSRPSILGDDGMDTGIDIILAPDGDTLLLNYRVHKGYTKKFAARVFVEFFDTDNPPSNQTVLTVIPRDLLYNGVTFNVDVRNVLTDGVTVFKDTSLSGETVTFPASSPLTRTDYLTLVGAATPVIIAENITRWKYGYWKRETIKIILE